MLVHRLIKRLAAAAPMSGALAPILHRLDTAAIRLTGSRSSLATLLTGLPVVVLTTTGARSGRPRSLPLFALLDEERFVLIASNFGRRHYPAWYHNLRAHPEASLSFNGRTGRYLAREAQGMERDRLWQRAVAAYPGYEKYAARAAHRRVPVMVLTPMADLSTSASERV